MGDFSHGHIPRKYLDSTGGEDHQFLFIMQDSFLTQHLLEPMQRECIRYSFAFTKLISGQCQNTRIIGNSGHNQPHFDIKVKYKIKKYTRNFHEGKYKDMRKYLKS